MHLWHGNPLRDRRARRHNDGGQFRLADHGGQTCRGLSGIEGHERRALAQAREDRGDVPAAARQQQSDACAVAHTGRVQACREIFRQRLELGVAGDVAVFLDCESAGCALGTSGEEFPRRLLRQGLRLAGQARQSDGADGLLRVLRERLEE